jgi:PKD repeat protein
MSARHLLPIALFLAVLSVRCSSSPAAPVGSVSVTVTTTTTTTTTIPGVNAGAIAATPSGVGLAAATVYSFAFTTPASGGVAPYTFGWTFGDGEEGAGPAPSHVYMNTGNFTVTVTVTDSRGTSARTSTTVSLRSVSGHWTAALGAGPPVEPIDLVQNQGAVTAAINDPVSGFGSGSGTVSNPRTLAITASFGAGTPTAFGATFVGQLNDTLTTWTGTASGFAGCPCTFTATRPTADAVVVRSTSARR